MIDTAPTGFFLFIGLMIAASVWLFSVPEAPSAPPTPVPPPEAPQPPSS